MRITTRGENWDWRLAGQPLVLLAGHLCCEFEDDAADDVEEDNDEFDDDDSDDDDDEMDDDDFDLDDFDDEFDDDFEQELEDEDVLDTNSHLDLRIGNGIMRPGSR